MPGRFYTKLFSEIDLSDPIFAELKADYPGTASSTGFVSWFAKKSLAGEVASVFEDEDGLGSFVYTKEEEEEIQLKDRSLPAVNRLKIGTFKMATAHRGQRLGEGALGLVLWDWQRSECDEIYVTVFPKHVPLIQLLTRFGFKPLGSNPNGETIFLRSKSAIDYSDPYRSFPFVAPNFGAAGLLVVEDKYHDTLFPYSELAHTEQEGLRTAAANGVSKVYIGTPWQIPPYRPGEPILIYRKFTGNGQAGYKSCITSYGVVTNIVVAKLNRQAILPLEEVLRRVGNKSVFDAEEITLKYQTAQSLVIVELIYSGYFGTGKNPNWRWLKDNGLWPQTYPTEARFTQAEFLQIIEKGGVDVQDALVD